MECASPAAAFSANRKQRYNSTSLQRLHALMHYAFKGGCSLRNLATSAINWSMRFINA